MLSPDSRRSRDSNAALNARLAHSTANRSRTLRMSRSTAAGRRFCASGAVVSSGGTLELVSWAHAAVGGYGSLRTRTCRIPLQHVPRAPPGQPHQVRLLNAAARHRVGEGVAQLVGMDVPDEPRLSPAV